MQLQKNDIWTRRERDKRLAVFVRQDVLIEKVKGLTEYILRVKYRYNFIQTVSGEKRKKQAVLPDTGASWRYAKKRGEFYYDYDRLPENRQKQLPSKEELLTLYERSMQSNAQSAMETDLLTYMKDLTPWIKAYVNCSDVQANHLARACAVVQFAAIEVASQEPTSSNDLYRNLAAIIKRRSWVYLPKNYRRLKEKIMQVVEGAAVTDVIKLPRQGNNNRKAYDDQQVISWMMYLRSRPENYTNSYIARRILKMCAIARKEAPSFSWLEHYFSRSKTKWLTGWRRHGSGRRGGDYRDYLPIEGALYAGDCWQMDGTRVNFIPHKSKDGKERSLMIIAVRDVHSGDIIGYHLDTKEDRYGYIHALNMAVVTTGHLPYEVVHDRFPGHNTDEWLLISEKMKREGVKISITSTATGKSHVERCFSTIQDVFMQDFAYYYGQGIQSKHDHAHRSPEYLAKAKKSARREGWDFDKAWRAASEVVELYRSTPLCEYSRKNATVAESPKQLYDASDTPNVHPVDHFTRVELFGTMRSVTIRNNGLIRMRIHKAEYCFRIDDYHIISNYKKVHVYYDLEELNKIYLFAPDEGINTHYLGEAMEERAIRYYGPDADMKALAKAKAKRKAIREQQKEELEELIGGAADEVNMLTAATTAKVKVDASVNRLLEEHVNVWKDQGKVPRLKLPERPIFEEEDDDEGEDLQVFRNY